MGRLVGTVASMPRVGVPGEGAKARRGRDLLAPEVLLGNTLDGKPMNAGAELQNGCGVAASQ